MGAVPILPYASVMEEVVKYTTVATITGGVRLSGLTWAGLIQYETVRREHNAGDAVRSAPLQSHAPLMFFGCCRGMGRGSTALYPIFRLADQEATTWILVPRLIRGLKVCAILSKSLSGKHQHMGIWWDEVTSRFNAPMRPTA